ncbi:hypothetical protein Lfu02_15290 [Longispora fulva]|uniref:Aminoglycoside phosphotransferase n=1 Tax=Longispora fulva TaxID=619741 RepID=A0A8J7GYD3_9ACTN|nr:hypothetical protein [Longispora fulva]MBG6140461.1 hypothetical protein [Longispora fulva]GIG57157.1 hypothetical protein Lfu02_15290 [Longispora fulva]
MTAEPDPDADQREWLRQRLRSAADALGVQLAGDPAFGAHLHAIGSRALTPEGAGRWLKLRYDLPGWGVADTWDGDQLADEIGVPKPHVHAWHTWADPDHPDIGLRADLMDLATGPALSTDMVLHEAPARTGAAWWGDLRAALDTIAAYPTRRQRQHPDEIGPILREYFAVDVDPGELDWATAHGDLHWGNLTGPRLEILDWDNLGTAPAGYDAATLLCTSLLLPDTAGRVHLELADLLDTPTGDVAQLLVAARLLSHIEHGDHADLEPALRAHASTVAGRLATR